MQKRNQREESRVMGGQWWRGINESKLCQICMKHNDGTHYFVFSPKQNEKKRGTGDYSSL